MPGHHPERHERLPVFREEAGHVGVKRPFVGLEAVEVSLLEGESAATILDREPQISRNDSRPEASKDAFD